MAEYFATVARGLEAIAATELDRLGAKDVTPGFCGVSFTGDLALLYRVNLWARLPFRVLMQVATMPCRSATELYQGIQSIDWTQYLTPEQTLAVKATGKTGELNHTHFTAVQVKTAITDQQQQDWGDRSTVDTQQPDVRINVHLHEDQAVVSLDSSGDSLHRRGYRPAVGLAPLKESLAAALIQLSEWQPGQAFFDPMCGSGTLPIEAGLWATQSAPGLFRSRFGFETWLDVDTDLWQQLKAEAIAAQTQAISAPIGGCDHDAAVIDQAQENLQRCGMQGIVQLTCADLSAAIAPADTGVLICNPPYGERLGQPQELGALYRRLGTTLKQEFKGWTAYILSGNKALSQHIGLKSAQRWAVYNGTIPCQLLKYELY